MDEKELDDLLNGLTNDSSSSSDADFNSNVDKDSGIDLESMNLDNISLDELDDLDNIKLDDLDIDDIDFDDVDVTKLSPSASNTNEDSGLDDDIFATAVNQEASDTDISDEMRQVLSDTTEKEPSYDDLDDLFSALGIESNSQTDDYTKSEDDFESLFETSELDALDDIPEIPEVKQKSVSSKKKKTKKDSTSKVKKTEKSPAASNADTDKEERPQRKSVHDVFFGEPDEDDVEEELYLQKKKAEKAVEKEKKNAEKIAKKAELDAQKSISKSEKEKSKKEALEAKKAAEKAELEAEKNNKPVSNVTVIIVFTFFAMLCVAVVLGASRFNYSQIIERAADYFDRQRYGLAYDEVAGVDVKEEDQQLKDRIYTVMYVERLYESYENNAELGRYDKALDALVRGLEKYDEHYDEAVELGIVEDIDYCKSKIIYALALYGLSEQQAYDILSLEGADYTSALLQYSELY